MRMAADTVSDRTIAGGREVFILVDPSKTLPSPSRLHSESSREAVAEIYFAARIDSTWIVLVLASSVPVTLTFCAANCSGVRWSLSV
jgi:hypothetical protein